MTCSRPRPGEWAEPRLDLRLVWPHRPYSLPLSVDSCKKGPALEMHKDTTPGT